MTPRGLSLVPTRGLIPVPGLSLIQSRGRVPLTPGAEPLTRDCPVTRWSLEMQCMLRWTLGRRERVGREKKNKNKLSSSKSLILQLLIRGSDYNYYYYKKILLKNLLSLSLSLSLTPHIFSSLIVINNCCVIVTAFLIFK